MKASSRNIDLMAKKQNITIEEALNIVSSRNYVCYVSKREKNFVNQLEIALGEELQYTYKTKQFCIWSKKLHRPFFYDIVDTKRMKVIEYNSDYYHANPSRYVAEDIIKKVNKTAQQIWDDDAVKIKAIKDRGFEVLIVWESEIKLEEIVAWFQQ